VNWNRLSPLDRCLLAACCFVIEGATCNFSKDQLVEKIHACMRTRFPGFHRGVEQSLRVFSANLHSWLQVRADAKTNHAVYEWIPLDEVHHDLSCGGYVARQLDIARFAS